MNELLCSSVSQRRCARLLRVTRTTVARRLQFLGRKAERELNKGLTTFVRSPTNSIQFDEMETFEHTKCKPISIALAVDAKTRKILGFQTASMPAKGTLTHLARKKYGPRKDNRRGAIEKLLIGIKPFVLNSMQIHSDECPRYPALIKRNFADAKHVTSKGRKPCIVGQGELKVGAFDPLFSLNHTCAMFRANVNRLVRKTWCTTKKLENLHLHLLLYANFHNGKLTPPLIPAVSLPQRSKPVRGRHKPSPHPPTKTPQHPPT